MNMGKYTLSALVCLLFLVTAYGRTLKQASSDNTTTSSTPAFLLDSTSSTTPNSNDVQGLTVLIKQFPALRGERFPDLSDDPCYPQELFWVACSNDDAPRVTALFLAAHNLYGYLPDFSCMDTLQIIDLHENSLYGSIPEFLGMFPELTYLDLSSNFFDGPLPASLANNKKIELNLAGNSVQLVPPATIVFPPPFPAVEFLVPPPPGSGNGSSNSPSPPDFKRRRRRRKKLKKMRLTRILRITIPTMFSITVVGGGGTVVYYYYERRRKKNRERKGGSDNKPTTPSSSDPTTPSSSDPTTPSSSDPKPPSSSDPTPEGKQPTNPSGNTPPSSSDPTPEGKQPTNPSGNTPVWLPPCSTGYIPPEWLPPCPCTADNLSTEWLSDVFGMNIRVYS